MKPLLFLSLALSLSSETAKKAETPVIPDSISASYWHDVAMAVISRQQLEKAEAAQKASTEALSKACGDKHVPQSDGSKLICVAKSEEIKK